MEGGRQSFQGDTQPKSQEKPLASFFYVLACLNLKLQSGTKTKRMHVILSTKCKICRNFVPLLELSAHLFLSFYSASWQSYLMNFLRLVEAV